MLLMQMETDYFGSIVFNDSISIRYLHSDTYEKTYYKDAHITMSGNDLSGSILVFYAVDSADYRNALQSSGME